LSPGGKTLIQFTEKSSIQGAAIYSFFKKASSCYSVNETRLSDLNPIFKKSGLKIVDQLRYSESSLGTNVFGVWFSTRVKIASSKLGILSKFFSGSILLLEKS
jgi:hypothetical protein